MGKSDNSLLAGSSAAEIKDSRSSRGSFFGIFHVLDSSQDLSGFLTLVL
ncbi:hypothetical protein [Chryseobacterium koreense]